MYHQFKELADVDITTEPMEVGPTCHYMMGGVRVDAETQESTVPGLFAAGEVGGGMHGANRLGGNSLSDLLVFGKRAGEFAAKQAEGDVAWARSTRMKSSAGGRVARAASATGRARTRTRFTKSCEQLMQSLRRHRPHGRRSASGAGEARRAARAGGQGEGRRQHSVQSRLAPGARSEEHARHQRGRDAGGAGAQESRGAHTREDFPDTDKEWGKVNVIVRQTRDGIQVGARAAAGDAGGVAGVDQGRMRAWEASLEVEFEVRNDVDTRRHTWPTKRRFASTAATTSRARWWTTRSPSRRAWSCSMRCTRCRPCMRRTWPCAGTARRATAARAAAK